MGAPVPGIGRAPDPHPFHVHRPAKVVLVLGLLAPASLPRRFACCPAGWVCAVLLPSAIAHVGRENLPAAQALGFALVGHGSPSWGACCQPKGNAHQQTPSPSPTEDKAEENKTVEIRGPKKTD